MAAFDLKYSEEQRRAVEDGKLARNLTYKRISELAAAGELVKGEPFRIPLSYVGHLCRAAQRRRVGQVESGLATKPPRDAREALRRELVNLVAAEIAAEKRLRDGKRDPDRLRQLARAVREIEQIKGATEPDPRSPASRDETGKATGPRSSPAIVGAIVKDHRSETADDASTLHHEGGDRASSTTHNNTTTEQQTDALPGAQPSEQAHAVLG